MCTRGKILLNVHTVVYSDRYHTASNNFACLNRNPRTLLHIIVTFLGLAFQPTFDSYVMFSKQIVEDL